MNFMEIAKTRQSCRSYDEERSVEQEKLESILEATRLSPSACNGQPYHFTVCTGKAAQEVAALTVGPGGMNKFAVQAPVIIVISEAPYVASAAMGAKIKIEAKTATVTGVETLRGATVCAHDLRAGAALVIAGLAAEGVTYVEHIHFIERGYESLVKKLTALGADICRLDD